MKVYFDRNKSIKYIDCTSAEFIEIQDFSNLQTWVDLADIPEALGDTIEQRINRYIELKKKGIIIVNSSKQNG